MLYRVFLQDEPTLRNNLKNNFRISYGAMNAWTYANPNWEPTIEEQLRAMSSGVRINSTLTLIDDHLTIECDGSTIGIVHSLEEISEKAYSLAKQKAIELRDSLERKRGTPWIFIDVTSRGDKKLAESLATQVRREYLWPICASGNPALCVDIGD